MKTMQKKQLAQAKERVMIKGIRAEDIKILNLLTEEQVADISEQNAYMWISTGKWNYKDFQRWLNAAAPFES